MYKKIRIIVFLLFSISIINADEPITVSDSEINGIYIGKYIKYLSEEKLFKIISKDWQTDDIFKEKIKSGQLHSDKNVKIKIENTDTGYKAYLRFNNKTGIIEWGLEDILKKEVLAGFKQSENEIPRFNFMPHSYWLMFTIENTNNTPADLYLQLDKYLFSMFHLFTVQDDKIIVKRGDFERSLADREVKDKNLTLKIKALPGKNTYFLRIDNWIMDTVPIRLWSPVSFYRHIANDNAVLGIFVGIFLLIFLYNIFIFIFMRDKSYLYLSLMTVCSLISLIVISGIGFQYIWPNNFYISIILFYSYFPLTMIFTLLFSQSFIEIYKYTPLINRYIIIMVISLTVFIPLIYLFPFSIQKILLASVFILDHIYSLPLFIPAIIVVYKKNLHGLFLLIALIFYVLSQAEWILTSLNIIPIRFINYLNIKGISFIIIMILGLGYKFRIMRKLIIDYKIKLQKSESKLKNKVITNATKLKIEQVKEFLKENFHENISRESLAGAVDMSPDHLGRIFKKDTGTRLSDFINQLRIKEAAKLLKNKETKIIDIAYEVGFESLRTFNTVFRQIEKVTPTDFRKNLN